MSLRSMTGFGLGKADINDGSLTIEVRSVNHRFFDARVRLPPPLAPHGPAIETLAKTRLVRGRVEIVARLEARDAIPVTLDYEKARSAYRQLETLRDELVPRRPVPLELLQAVPELFVTSSPPQTLEADPVLTTAEAALDSLDQMRATEGAALGVDIAKRLTAVRDLVDKTAVRAADTVDTVRARLKERIAKLLGDVPEVSVADGRLEVELAIAADRSDVSEELVRLGSHLDQLDAFLAEGGAVGRRIDFLLQEMNRETNTVGSKSSDAELAHLVVEIKTELERIREQVQNLV